MASWYRQGAFIALGLSTFTRAAFLKKQAHFKDDLSKADLSGKVVAITGANSGIGLEAARALHKQGATVHLICRDRERGEKARQQLQAEYTAAHPAPPPSSPRLFLHIVDLSSIAQTRAFSRAFVASQSPLHVLINNAGGMTHTLVRTAEQLESNFATNVASVFVLTQELLPVLRRSNSAGFVSRVITVSSGGMLTQDLDPSDLNFDRTPWTGDATFVYAQNKRQQVALTELWQRHEHTLSASPSTPCVLFYAMHPGWAETPAVISAMPDFHRRMKGKWRTPAEGADTIVWLAAAPSLRQWREGGEGMNGGEFFLDREVVSKKLTGAWYKGVDDWAVKEQLESKLRDAVKAIEPTPEQVQAYTEQLQQQQQQ